MANFRPPTHPLLSTWLLNAPKYGIKNFLYCLLYCDKSEATDKNNASNERIFHISNAKILKNLMIKDSEAIKLY